MTYSELSPDEQRRLVAAYDAGMAAGSAQPWRVADDDVCLLELIIAVSNVWWLSRDTEQAVARLDEMDVWPDNAPAWLRAHAERQVLERREPA